jgi:hypothetical protein
MIEEAVSKALIGVKFYLVPIIPTSFPFYPNAQIHGMPHLNPATAYLDCI